MRVTLVTPKFNVREAYGGEVSVKLLADELTRRGHDVRVLASDTDGADGRVTRADLTSANVAKLARGSDVVHAYNMDGIGAALAGARRAGVPAVASANSYWAACLWADMCWPDGQVCERCTVSGLKTCYSTRNPATIGRRVPALLGVAAVRGRTSTLSRFDRIVVLSEASKRQFVSAGAPEEKIDVVPNMTDASLDASRELPPLSPSREILSVGALKHTKGHSVLIDAMPAILRAVPDARLSLVGNGPDEPLLRERARAAGVDARVSFEGRVDPVQLAERYRRARVVAFPVVWEEPFGRVTLEAWAHGTPLVVSDRGGPGEVVAHERDGLVVPANDAAVLAPAIARALTDDALANRLRAGGRAALARFAPDVVVPKIVGVYERARREWLEARR